MSPRPYTLTMAMAVMILCTMIQPSHQGFFDSVTSMWDMYDAAQCSLNIAEVFLIAYNQPICCVFWKVKKFFQSQANKRCESPQNVEKMLNGVYFREYIDLSPLNCSKYPEDSPDCDHLWAMLITFLVLYVLFMLCLITAVLLVTIGYLRYRRQYRKLEAKMNDFMEIGSSSSISSSSDEDEDDSPQSNKQNSHYLYPMSKSSLINIDSKTNLIGMVKDENVEPEEFVYPRGNGFIAVNQSNYDEELTVGRNNRAFSLRQEEQEDIPSEMTNALLPV